MTLDDIKMLHIKLAVKALVVTLIIMLPVSIVLFLNHSIPEFIPAIATCVYVIALLVLEKSVDFNYIDLD